MFDRSRKNRHDGRVMTGERDLNRLLAGLAPELDSQAYAFVCVPTDTPTPARAWLRLREAEGDTLILPAEEAHGLGPAHPTVFRRIVLRVHSDLDAVGLTAAVSARLTEADIPCNVVAGFHHDHLFVPAPLAERAMDALRALSHAIRANDAGSRHS